MGENLAIVGGSNHAPTIDLIFGFNDTHPVTGVSLREWVKDQMAATFDNARRLWSTIRVPDDALTRLGDAGFTVMTWDGVQPDLSLATVPVLDTSDVRGMVSVYPRLGSPDDLLPAVGDGAVWQADNRRYLVPDTQVNAIRALRHIDLLGQYQPIDRSAAANPLIFDGTIDGLRGVKVSDLDAVDPMTAVGMSNMGINSVYDLLHTIPRRYLDRSNPVPVSDIALHDDATFIGTVREIKVPPAGNSGQGVTIVTVVDDSDGTTRVSCRWFNARYIARKVRVGQHVLISGKMDEYVYPSNGYRLKQINNPLIDVLTGDDAVDSGVKVIGVYPASKEITTWKIRRAVKEALHRLPAVTDPIPADILQAGGWISRDAALRRVHAPDSLDDAENARQRLAYDELMRWQLVIASQRFNESNAPGIAHQFTGNLFGSVELPFTMTQAQQRSITEIESDLRSTHPMHRLLQGDVGAGKAQPLDAKVLTPTGFKNMGDMAVGDSVVSATGHIASVQGVYPQGQRDVYTVTLSDGTKVRADGDHLWSVATSTMRHKNREPRLMTTLDLMGDLHEKSGASKWHIEAPEPVDIEDGGDRPLDPYLLGVLLGDGSLSSNASVSVTTVDEQMVDLVHDSLPDNMTVSVGKRRGREHILTIRLIRQQPDLNGLTATKKSTQDARDRGADMSRIGRELGLTHQQVTDLAHDLGVSTGRIRNAVLDGIERLGLTGCTSRTKFIPDSYKNAPIGVRHAILQGLMDTDGTSSHSTGSDVSFTTVSERLVQDVAWLVRSLGGLSSVTKRLRKSGDSWRVRVTLPNSYEPFRLDRKAKYVKQRSKYAYPARAIRSIEKTSTELTQCILIDHPSHLYVTDNFTVTHNTLVCQAACLDVVESGYTAAIMSPTAVLAQQHYDDLIDMTSHMTKPDGSPVRVELLTIKVTGKKRKAVEKALAAGEVDIVVGTSALLSEKVTIAGLGLVVVDEQHRFGVEQRAELSKRAQVAGWRPDILVMTATPAPRTAVLTIFGDLDVSTLDQPPSGRLPIRTILDTSIDSPADAAWREVASQVAAGRQAFVVTPVVSTSEKKMADGAEALAAKIRSTLLPGLSVGVVHGKQTPADRAGQMGDFIEGRTQVLVATTVIEVGVNVPNATVMVITGAESFGIAQLHQIRGRVGRGKHPGVCYLIPSKELGATDGARLQALVDSTDGFYLAQRDLEIRGPGSLAGVKQSGRKADLRIASLVTDIEMVATAREDASALIQLDPGLNRYPMLRHEIDNALGADGVAALATR